MGCVWNARHLSLSQFSFYNIASFNEIQTSDNRFEIMVLNGPFCVGFNWFCTPFLLTTLLSQKLARVCLWCCLPFPVAVIPMNVKCHFLIFQSTCCLLSTGRLKIQYFCYFSVFLIRWYSANIYVFCKKCVQIPLIVILRFWLR